MSKKQIDPGQMGMMVKPLFSPDDCKKLIDYVEARFGWETALLGGSTDEKPMTEGVRKTKVVLVPHDETTAYFYNKIYEAALWANETYQFQILECEPMQILKYEEGDFYIAHFDNGGGTEKSDEAVRRKLSIVINLSDPDDYEGGGLSIYTQDPPLDGPPDQGMASIFPSFMLHRANEVTSGTRYVAVCWFKGAKFQ